MTFSKDAVYLNEGDSSHISRDVGEQMTMEQCLYGMLLESANECAYAIAEHVGGGDVNVFVDMMNQKAAELGCQDSHFNNTNGLPDENHYVSAYDMALISRAAYQNPTFAKIIGTESYQIPPTNTHADPTPLNNHHSMLHPYHTSRYVYPYCLGGKTGYTRAANSTLVTYAAKDGMTLVCVVLNVTSPGHWIDTTNLFNYCFDNFAAYNVADQASPFAGDVDGSLGSLAGDGKLATTDPHGTVVLPKTASLADAQAEVVPEKQRRGSRSGRTGNLYLCRALCGTDHGQLSAEREGRVPLPQSGSGGGRQPGQRHPYQFLHDSSDPGGVGGNCPRDFRAGTDLFPDQYPPAQTEEQRKEEKACLPADSQEPPERPQILEERTSRGYAGSGIGDIRQIEGISLSYAGT